MTHTPDTGRPSPELPNAIQDDWPKLDPHIASRLRLAMGREPVGGTVYARELATRLGASLDAVPIDVLPDTTLPIGDETNRTTVVRQSPTHGILIRPRSTSGGLPPAAAMHKPFWRYLMFGVVCLTLFGAGMQWMRIGAGNGGSQTGHASQIYATAKAERVTVTLPDGSDVTLNADSRLEIAPGFGTRHRDAVVHGEAYFSVVSMPNVPFRVTARTTTTQVLGTRFNVRGYATDSAVQVSVVQGRVLVGHTILNAGDVGSVIGSHEPTVTHDTLIARHIAWIRGGLVFDDLAFQKILVQLERVYDVEIRLGDSTIGQRRISGAIEGQTVHDVMQFFAIMLDARFERQGRVITFYSR